MLSTSNNKDMLDDENIPYTFEQLKIQKMEHPERKLNEIRITNDMLEMCTQKNILDNV